MTRATVPASLPARPAYHAVSDELHTRLRAAEARMCGLEAHDVVPPSVMEAAVAELDAVHKAIEDHEAEGRDLDTEAQWEREHSEGGR
jgi:hypothetical protein